MALAVLDRLHDDDTGKDVELVASDGVVRAHSLMLSAISEPFRAMLSNGMAETTTKRIQMADFTEAQLKFILRLLCTGGMDTSEWPLEGCQDDKDDSGSQVGEWLCIHVSAPSIRGAPLAGTEFRMKPTTKYRNLMKRFCDRAGVNLDDISFSAGGQVVLPTDTPASSGLMHKDLVATQKNLILIGDSQKSNDDLALYERPPLEFLFSAASFAKMYDIQEYFMAVIIERLKACINMKNFDNIMVLAIKLDLAPIRMAGLLYAQRNDSVRASFDQEKWSPQVQFELQAIWSAVHAKRRRL